MRPTTETTINTAVTKALKAAFRRIAKRNGQSVCGRVRFLVERDVQENGKRRAGE